MNKLILGVVCLGVGVVIGGLCAAYWAYISAASVPIIGGLIAAQMRKRVKRVVNIDLNGSAPAPQKPKFPFSKDRHSKFNR